MITAVQSFSAVLNLIFSLVGEQNWSQALEQCLVLIGSNDARVFFLAGLSCWKQGNNAEAVDFFGKALASDPQCMGASYAHNCIGLQCRRLATAEKDSPDGALLLTAIEHFQDAIALDKTGKTGIYRNSLAGCLALLGRLAEAIACYDLAIAYGYHRPGDCLYNKGICLYALGRHDEAYQTFSDLVAMQPDHGKARLWMAKLQLNMLYSSPDSVTDTIEAAIPGLSAELETVKSSSAQQYRRSVYLVRSNHYAILQQEETALNAAIADIAEAYGLAAVAFARLADWGKAESAIRSCHHHDKNSPLICQALWVCRLTFGAGLELADRLTAEFRPPHPIGAEVHYPAAAGAAYWGDSGSDEYLIGSLEPGIASESTSKYDFPIDALSVFASESDLGSPQGFSLSDSGITVVLNDQDSPDNLPGWDDGTGSLSDSGITMVLNDQDSPDNLPGWNDGTGSSETGSASLSAVR